MKSLLIKRGITDEQTALMTQEEWRKAVGPALAAETRPGNLQRGQLYVYASSNLVLQELHFSKTSILKALQSALPDFKIRDLRFRVEARS
jgi:predicted nucleic acid-binding Zn ribbon protein